MKFSQTFWLLAVFSDRKLLFSLEILQKKRCHSLLFGVQSVRIYRMKNWWYRLVGRMIWNKLGRSRSSSIFKTLGLYTFLQHIPSLLNLRQMKILLWWIFVIHKIIYKISGSMKINFCEFSKVIIILQK